MNVNVDVNENLNALTHGKAWQSMPCLELCMCFPCACACGWRYSLHPDVLAATRVLLARCVKPRVAPCGCAEKLELDDMQAERVKKYNGTAQYAKDKRRMTAYCEEFARRWQVRMHL